MRKTYVTLLTIILLINNCFGNTENGHFSDIAGGKENSADGDYCFIGGGKNNTVKGQGSSILGGFNNIASGDYSATIGKNGYAIHDNSIVLAFKDNSTCSSKYSNSITMCSHNGVFINDRNIYLRLFRVGS